jgi:sentrin-specific protease 8
MLRKVRGRFGDKLNPDDAFLSYHDVRLTREDMQTLKNDWLTDNVGLNGEIILLAWGI